MCRDQRLGLAPPSRTLPLSAVAAETIRTGRPGLAPPNRTLPASPLTRSDGRTDGEHFRHFYVHCASIPPILISPRLASMRDLKSAEALRPSKPRPFERHFVDRIDFSCT